MDGVVEFMLICAHKRTHASFQVRMPSADELNENLHGCHLSNIALQSFEMNRPSKVKGQCCGNIQNL